MSYAVTRIFWILTLYGLVVYIINKSSSGVSEKNRNGSGKEELFIFRRTVVVSQVSFRKNIFFWLNGMNFDYSESTDFFLLPLRWESIWIENEECKRAGMIDITWILKRLYFPCGAIV